MKNRLADKINCYLQLMKPSIMMLVLVTGSAALVTEGQFLHQPLDFLLVLTGLFLTGGSANALNQYFERHIDALMKRTQGRRPLPMGKIGNREALIFAIVIGIIGVALFYVRFNALSAALALTTVLFYGLFYTLWLKPNTCQNIVIGGAAGAMAPVISWAAAANSMDVTPWILFMIIFLWTPPHFWALALYLKDDYEKVNLPMMPLVKGDDATIAQICFYTIAMVIASLALFVFEAGMIYLTVAAVMGGIFISKSISLRKSPSQLLERGLFRFSIVYLFGLFLTLIVESLIGR